MRLCIIVPPVAEVGDMEVLYVRKAVYDRAHQWRLVLSSSSLLFLGFFKGLTIKDKTRLPFASNCDSELCRTKVCGKTES